MHSCQGPHPTQDSCTNGAKALLGLCLEPLDSLVSAPLQEPPSDAIALAPTVGKTLLGRSSKPCSSHIAKIHCITLEGKAGSAVVDVSAPIPISPIVHISIVLQRKLLDLALCNNGMQRAVPPHLSNKQCVVLAIRHNTLHQQGFMLPGLSQAVVFR